jgi:hypothetical protein
VVTRAARSVADVVQATDITFADEPMRGIAFGLAAVVISGYFVWHGRRWRRYTQRRLDRIRKENPGYVSRWPDVDYFGGLAFGALGLFVLFVSCVFLITRS